MKNNKKYSILYDTFYEKQKKYNHPKHKIQGNLPDGKIKPTKMLDGCTKAILNIDMKKSKLTFILPNILSKQIDVHRTNRLTDTLTGMLNRLLHISKTTLTSIFQ